MATKDELLVKATALKIEGAEGMKKEELEEAVEKAEKAAAKAAKEEAKAKADAAAAAKINPPAAAKKPDVHKDGAKYRVKKTHKSPVQMHVVKGPIKGNLIEPGYCVPKDADPKTIDSLLKRGIIEEIK